MVVDSDDARKTTYTQCVKTTTGILRIGNSCGTTWGDVDYVWLPYIYEPMIMATI